MLEAKCGRTRSRKGKPFTNASLQDHEQACKDCQQERQYEEGFDLEMTDMIAGDESDGVYWAMAQELGEW